ncbi:hypothetical protein BDV98DRAFT_585985 [Pterulicium gracile]|uniref:Uncharacterized protein n=1 Tax=Pterulicium gracile TaxID=1884261 RepID=A0A5C3Q9G6_9AGAR|nr:hypothetical protein BDV98DRAFT_585985 [Pterula gracilis]
MCAHVQTSHRTYIYKTEPLHSFVDVQVHNLNSGIQEQMVVKQRAQRACKDFNPAALVLLCPEKNRRALKGKPIVKSVDSDSTGDFCSKILSALVNLDRTAYVAKIINLDCRHKMTIYISDEQKYPDLCIAIVAPNHQEPHLHPALPPTKVPRNVRKKYKQCVTAIGVIGATIGQVEHALFTLLILGRKTPSLYHPGLQSCNAKAKIIFDLKNSEAGGRKTGVQGKLELFHSCNYAVTDSIDDYAAVMELWKEHMKKLCAEQYTYAVQYLEGRKVIVVTTNPYLLSFIHTVTAIDQDTTFKCVYSKINKYKIVAWLLDINQSFGDSIFLTIEKKDIKNSCGKTSDVLKWTLKQVKAFDSWVQNNLGIKRVLDWWEQKVRSKILLPATTNVEKAQHHRTNQETNTKLSLKEAIIWAETFDKHTAEEIKFSMGNRNPRVNGRKLSHCVACSVWHKKATATAAAVYRQETGKTNRIQANFSGQVIAKKLWPAPGKHAGNN